MVVEVEAKPVGRASGRIPLTPKKNVRPRRALVFPYLLIAPLILALVVFTYLPLVAGVRLSVTDEQFGAARTHFVGLLNYEQVARDVRFWRIFYQTVVWTVLSVGGSLVLGVLSSLALQRRTWQSAVVRSLLLLPWAAPPLVVVYVWRYLVSTAGPISPHLIALTSSHSTPDILSSSYSWLGISSPLLAVIFLGVWAGFPFVFVFALGALSSIPVEVHEAAYVDGASQFQVVRFITWPLIRPVVETAVVLLALTRFGGLEIPFLLTGGGPGDASSVLGVLIYNTAFGTLQGGLASTLGVVVFIVMLPLALYYVRRALRPAYS